MPTAHDSWAQVYDLVYERSYPGHLDHLTKSTIKVVQKWQPAPGKIVDFGAGTGRLAIPLANSGYSVTAVDPSSGMLDVLKQKEGSAPVQPVNSTMQNFLTLEAYDMALCVFTVIIYLLDQTELERALEAATNAVKRDGFLLIDVPSRAIFSGIQIENEGFRRISRVEAVEHDLYRYRDDIELEHDGETKTYLDDFMIRYWHPDKIKTLLQEFGMALVEELKGDFLGSGSTYFLFRKNT